jgi:hypothetical protein
MVIFDSYFHLADFPSFVRYGVLMVIIIRLKITVFRNVTTCLLVDWYKCFGVIC